MAIIRTDNPLVEKELNTMISLVEEGGGGIHSELVIECFENNITIKTDRDMRDREIIRLSKNVLLSEAQYKAEIKNDQFYTTIPAYSAFTDLQKRLTDSVFTLYNLTDKARLHKDMSFLLGMKKHPEVMAHLEKGRPMPKKMSEWKEMVQGEPSDEHLNTFTSETFLKTRYLGYNDVQKASSSSIIMPIVDLLNHNWGGSPFRIGKGVRAGDLCVDARQPYSEPDENYECFAFYGIMDALDTLMRYDFADISAPIVRSVPLNIMCEDFDTEIIIHSNTGFIFTKDLTAQFRDLYRYMPSITYQAKKKRWLCRILLFRVMARLWQCGVFWRWPILQLRILRI